MFMSIACFKIRDFMVILCWPWWCDNDDDIIIMIWWWWYYYGGGGDDDDDDDVVDKDIIFMTIMWYRYGYLMIVEWQKCIAKSFFIKIYYH
jgi:hypothetical protein